MRVIEVVGKKIVKMGLRHLIDWTKVDVMVVTANRKLQTRE